MLDVLESIISCNKLDDIVITGVTSIEDGTAEFIPNMKSVYFNFEDTLLEFESVEQYSKISIKKVESLKLTSEFEDVIPSSTSISRIVFMNSIDSNKVKSIGLINQHEYSEGIECDAVEIILENNQMIFIDPMFFGINLGGEEQKRLWEENRQKDDPYQLTKIKG